MTGLDRGPTTVSSLTSVGSSLVVALAVGSWYWPGLFVVAPGVGCVLLGLYRRSRTLLGGGLACFVVGAVLAALAGVPVEPLLLGSASAVLAWDAGERAITVGEQLGRTASTARIELLHATATAFVGSWSVGITYLAFSRLSVSYPLSSIVLLCIGVVSLLYARRSER